MPDMYWGDFFTTRPCDDGWEAFKAALRSGGLKETLDLDDYVLWGAEFTNLPEALALLADHDYYAVRGEVASNAFTPPEVLVKLARDANADVRARVADNSKTPPEVLAALARDTNDEVCLYAALNPSTPTEALTDLANDRYALYVARNPSAPEALLRSLATHADCGVRMAVARHQATPADVITALHADPHNLVLKAVMERADVRVELLERVMKFESPSMRAAVVRSPGATAAILTELSRDPESLVRGAVALNHTTPPEVLAALINDSNRTVAAFAARNPHTPPDAIRNAALSLYEVIRHAAFLNPNIPAGFLRTVDLTNPTIQEAVVRNVGTPPDVLAQLFEVGQLLLLRTKEWLARHKNTPGEVLRKLADVYPLSVATNPGTPGEVLHYMAISDPVNYEGIAEEIANHPNATAETLKLLTRCFDEAARVVAARRLAAGSF